MKRFIAIPIIVALAACGEQVTEPDGRSTANFSVQNLDAATCAARVPTYFVEPTTFPTSIDPTLDLAWQAAAGNFYELDLDAGFPDRSNINQLASGSLTVDLGLAGIRGLAPTVKMFFGAYPTGGGSYGTVWGGALLNVFGGVGNDYAHSQMTFDFSRSVSGFGAWVFDDAQYTEQSFRLIATDTDGTTATSSLLESGNGDPHWVEGFIGVTSAIGIEAVAIEVLDESGRAVVFEVDHLQISLLPEPTTAAEWASAARDAILGLYCTGELDEENTNGLFAKLDAVDRSLENDKPSAPNQLGAFIHQVEAFMSAKVLTPEQGQELIDAAKSAIDALGG